MGSGLTQQEGIQQTILGNGLELLTLESHHLPIVTVMIWYRVGSSYSLPGKTGIAHLVEHMMFKGTPKFAKGAIDLLTQKFGGSNNAFTSADYTCYFFNFPSQYWEQALEIEADRMLNCNWDAREFASEKNVVLTELASSLDSPMEFLTQQAEALCYQYHTYRHPILGWQNDLQQLTLEEAYAYYKQYYVPNNAIIVVTGDINSKMVAAKVRKLFAPIKPGVPAPPAVRQEPAPVGQKRIVIRKQVEISRFAFLFLTCSTGTFDDYVLDLIEIVLFCGRNARFFKRFVLEETLVQSISGFNDTRRGPGLFWILGAMSPHIPPDIVESEIGKELQRLRSRPITKYELQRAKNIFLVNFVFEQETNYDMANKIGEFAVLCDHAKLNEAVDIVQNITVADIQKIANKYLDLEKATVSWLLPNVKTSRKYRPKQRRKIALPKGKIATNDKAFSFTYAAHSSRFINNDGSLAVHKKKLANGLTILMLPNSRLPCVSVDLHFKNVLEPKGREGTGNLLGRLLIEGTKRRRAEQITHTVEFIGSGLSTKASGISVKVLNKDFDLMLDLIADIVTNATLPVSALKREKQKTLEQLLCQKDSPYYRGFLEYRRLIYGNHPYARPFYGTCESIAQITREDLLKYRAKRFIPNRAVLVIVGDVNPDKVFPTIEKAFGDWQPGKPHPPSFPKLKLGSKSLTKYIPMDKQQLVTYWGHLGITRLNPDYHRLLLLDHILGEGAGFTDRLSKIIRDEMGLCYSIECSISSNASEQPGALTALLTTSPENYSQALQVLIAEINKLKNNGVSEQEVEYAKSYLIKSHMFALEENDSLAAHLLKLHRYKLPFDYISSFPKKIEQITPRDVQTVAKKYLHPEIATSVVVGPVGLIKK